MFNRFGRLVLAWLNFLMGKVEDPQVMLEQAYEDLQSNVLQVREATAHAMATEKQLQIEYQRANDQVTTWQNRAATAVSQGNDDLAKQALQRKQQYAQAAHELEAQIESQKKAIYTLKEKLSELESEVQKARTRKQVLIARDNAARALGKSNEILSDTSAKGALTIMSKMEQKINEKEAHAAALQDLGRDNLDTKFRVFEGRVDVENELMQLKEQLRPKITIREQEPKLLGAAQENTPEIKLQGARQEEEKQ